MGQQEGGSLAGKHVLLVEDRYLLADDIRRDLESKGAQVVGPAPTSGKAIALLNSERIDVAVLDIDLADGTVFPAIEVLEEKAIPFLLVTGYSLSSLPKRLSTRPFLSKPVSSRALERELTGLLLAPDGSTPQED